MVRARELGVVALGMVLVLALAGCDDDESVTVSQESYDETAAALCERHFGEFTEARAEYQSSGRSDAEQAALFRAEFVPRVRAIVRGINRAGYPADKEADYRAALGAALAAAQEIEDDTYELIDRRRRGDLPEDEDPFDRITEAFDDADVPC